MTISACTRHQGEQRTANDGAASFETGARSASPESATRGQTKTGKAVCTVFSFLVLFMFYAHAANAQIAAAGWCVIQPSSSQSDSPAPEPPDDPFPPQPDEQTQASQLGCDIGVGFLLYRPSNPKYNRFALVAVVGSESLGPGIAYILNPNAKSEADHRPIMAIAIGVTTPYDKRGIIMDPKLTLGMTLSLRQGVDK